MNILLVEDNENIATGLEYFFKQNQYPLTVKSTFLESVNYLKTETPDFIILDITLPDGNGFELYEKQIQPKGIPTIFLTARDDEDDVVKGLNLGAEDYMTKPFSTKELFARMNKILLRKKQNAVIQVGDIRFDLDKMEVCKNDEKVMLTSLEMKILYLLFINLNKVVRRLFIIEKVWEWTGNDINDNTVTVYMKRIREKLDSDMIVTIKGIGYRIDSDEK